MRFSRLSMHTALLLMSDQPYERLQRPAPQATAFEVKFNDSFATAIALNEAFLASPIEAFPCFQSFTPLIEKGLPFRYKCFATNSLPRNGEADRCVHNVAQTNSAFKPSRVARSASDPCEHAVKQAKIGAHIKVSVRRVVFSMASGYPDQDLFSSVLSTADLPPEVLTAANTFAGKE
jgi:hypothetical protein